MRKKQSLHPVPTPVLSESGQHWAIDFVPGQLGDGCEIAVLTAFDRRSGESVWLEVNLAPAVTAFLRAFEPFFRRRSLPVAISVVNFSELTSNGWTNALAAQSAAGFILLGKPIENGVIELNNGRMRIECLNT